MAGKFVIDISTLIRWVGTPVGLVRVERELAVWAHENLPNVEFAVFDFASGIYRRVEPRWLDLVFSGSAVIWGCPRLIRVQPAQLQAARKRRLGPPLRLRRWSLLLLERARLAARSPRFASLVERLQALLLTEKYAKAMTDEKGKRRAVVTHRTVVGGEVAFDAQTTLIVASLAWPHTDVDAIARLKQETGMAFVFYCADLIPVQFPHLFPADGIAPFESDHRAAFPIADLTVVTARKIEEDVRSYCRETGLALGKVVVLHLGADAVSRGRVEALPQELERDKYALFVSTIEPRKGHGLLYRVWLRLLAEGIPQAEGFRLVFVGRKGWMVDELIHDLENDERLRGSFTLFHSAPDSLLQSLYANAAFCLFPSAYEGFGLPLVEAFLHGKAVIASTGGALPEIAEGFAPCLDPNDEDAWYEMLKSWILDPGERQRYERAIKADFRALTWSDFASRFFAEAAALNASPGDAGAS